MAPARLIVADEPAAAGADWIAARLGEAIAARGHATLALSGGTSPQPMHEALATRPVAWDRVELYFVDERAVPPDDPRSNYGMARARLVERVALRAVHRMPAERPDLEAAARDYAALLPERLDVVVLGVGHDGHTASLFPGTDWSRGGWPRALVTRSPEPPIDRMTISPDLIRGAGARLVLATGGAKAEIVRVALEEPPDPARHPVGIAGDATWLLDFSAASRLRRIHG